jgi:hypothetical protein
MPLVLKGPLNGPKSRARWTRTCVMQRSERIPVEISVRGYAVNPTAVGNPLLLDASRARIRRFGDDAAVIFAVWKLLIPIKAALTAQAMAAGTRSLEKYPRSLEGNADRKERSSKGKQVVTRIGTRPGIC